MKSAIAIVGMACQYPDARSPIELWENVLAQRRAFRRMPPERLSLEDYWSDNRALPDHTYGTEVALIEGYKFDRVGFRVTGNAFRSADFAHWLALDIATQALQDAGFPQGEGLPNEQTGVLLGNTLTGEFSRTNTLRLRWPYVRRVLESALAEESDCLPEQRSAFFKKLEAAYKAPFPAVGEETLAGNLSNTIAGRICNHYDLKGGGYTLDGACSSSLLAVAQACTALAMGDLDVALAGGVDLSLDPFELVGFAKAGALANGEMRVYDARSAGFWPGEGCGFVVLMRQEDAIAQQRPIYAVIRGWGISSDGNGGITRPDVEGQLLAIRRAYKRAGFGAETVSYFEGHGTGTSVGDMTELEVLSRARCETTDSSFPAAIGSIKANIGHTKAAAGLAGLIKAVMVLRNQVLPPTTGCEQPHPKLLEENPALRVLRQAEPWPKDTPCRAGVSAMGFGGINAHVVLEAPAIQQRQELTSHERRLSSSSQDCEVFLLNAETVEKLITQVTHLLTLAPRLSRSELIDLAAELGRALTSYSVRAAVVATTPQELTSNLETLKFWLENGIESQLDSQAGVFLGTGISSPKIGFLFPGQASPSYLKAGVWGQRFSTVQALYDWANLPQDGDRTSTDIAQPAIMTSSMAGLRTLEQLGIVADVAVGHSLGELAALHWAGVWDEATLLHIVTARGQAMARLGSATGAMASIQAEYSDVKALINGDQAVIAGLNSPQQTIISGDTVDIATVVGRAQSRGLKAVILPVSHAFHSPLVAAAVQPLEEHLKQEKFNCIQRSVVSTISGTMLSETDDLRSLLCRQVTEPVRFIEAIEQAAKDTDLFIEVGPGKILSRLAQNCVEVPVVSLDAGGTSLRGLMNAVGATYAIGSPIKHSALFIDRFTRPFSLDWQPRFFVNPCELAPKLNHGSNGHHSSFDKFDDSSNPTLMANEPNRVEHSEVEGESIDQINLAETTLPIDVVRYLVAAKTELPLAAVQDNNRLLSDLHLNSITVSQIVVDASRQLGLAPPVAPTHYADATVAEVAKALEELIELGGTAPSEVEIGPPLGVDAWVRTFTVEQVERPLSRRSVSRKVDADDHTWQVFAPENYSLLEVLESEVSHLQGPGVVVCLPPDNAAEAMPHAIIELLLQGARAALAEPKAKRFVLVQHGKSSAAFVRTLHLEFPHINTCVVNVPVEHPHAVEWILAEVQASTGYSEARYDFDGKRYESILRLLPSSEETELSLTTEDVLLVTGGGKGIAAECAIALARETGVRLAIMGRSQPDADEVLSTNLERMAATGVQVRYVAADVTDALAVKEAVEKFEASFGPVTAIIHGAGVNEPKLVGSLELEDFQKTLAPKIDGIHHVTNAIDPDRLKLLVTFGSIIARTGLPGEADYGLANEWLAQWIQQFQENNSQCRCLNIEWSIWSGVGMGERLGRIDILAQQGITAITPDIGIGVLRGLLTKSLSQPSVVVTGRFGEPPTLKVEQPQLPFLRFLEQPRVYYPGVELVVDVELSVESDPYLNDHVFQDERVFPAVMGLEAMAQVSMALTETSEIPIFEDVVFQQSIVVSVDTPLKIRLAALVKAPGVVSVAVRSAQTGFHINHFEATCRFEEERVGIGEVSLDFPDPETSPPPHSLDPEKDLYGNILFHSGRFQRLKKYWRLRSRECIAEIQTDSNTPWFSRYFPNNLVLGDPASRDGAIHALQACIPQATILPVGVKRVILGAKTAKDKCFVYGQEKLHEGDRLIYDVDVIGSDSLVQERWEGLQLQVMHHQEIEAPQTAMLLGPYIERKLREISPEVDVSVILGQDSALEKRVRSNRLIQHVLQKPSPVWRRSDGKPEVLDDINISVAHTDDLTIVVTGMGFIGCDIEPITKRPIKIWQDLLGKERFILAKEIAQKNNEDLDASATRLWCATECLEKCGKGINIPLIAEISNTDRWLTLTAGDLNMVTVHLQVNNFQTGLILALITDTRVKSYDSALCHYEYV